MSERAVRELLAQVQAWLEDVASVTGQPPTPEQFKARDDAIRSVLKWAIKRGAHSTVLISFDDVCRERDAARAEADTLREYWEASQAVQGGIIDFDLHSDQVTRLEKATETVREALAGRESPKPCPACHGKGLEGQDDRPGLILPAHECPVCRGSGRETPK